MTGPKDKTILVVDDEEDIREFLSTVLEDAGFGVVTAADGEEALERVEKSAPDFVSVDLVMPRKTGLEFLRELREKQEWRNIPVLVVTSHAHDDVGDRRLPATGTADDPERLTALHREAHPVDSYNVWTFA